MNFFWKKYDHKYGKIGLVIIIIKIGLVIIIILTSIFFHI